MEVRVKAKRKKSSENMKINLIYFKRLCNRYLLPDWSCLVTATVIVPKLQRTNFPAPFLGDHITSVVRDNSKGIWILLQNKAKTWQNQQWYNNSREEKENKKS